MSRGRRRSLLIAHCSLLPGGDHGTGNGGAGTDGFTTVPSVDTIALTGGATPVKAVYLALTFNGQSMTLFVDGEPQGSMDVAYMPNTAQPIWIGAGAPFAAESAVWSSTEMRAVKLEAASTPENA